MMNEFIKEIKKLNIGKLERDISIKRLTTYKVGGVARVLIYPKNESKLVILLKLIKKYNLPYKIIGNGSNLIFSDKDYEGVLIKLTELNQIEIFENKIRVGAGYSLMKLSRVALKHSLTGLEFAAGIPATVGGATFMNAGAYKSDMGYIVQSIRVLTPDFQIIELENRELNFHYRTSFLKTHRDYICLEVLIKLQKGDKILIDRVMRERLQRRMESQPLNYPSAGSVFRNPKDQFSGELIENAGLKGFQIGGAMVSEKHANFIINKGNATAQDVKDVIFYTKEKVKEKYDIDLLFEQEFVNWE